jgi:hypothetical protein
MNFTTERCKAPFLTGLGRRLSEESGAAVVVVGVVVCTAVVAVGPAVFEPCPPTATAMATPAATAITSATRARIQAGYARLRRLQGV